MRCRSGRRPFCAVASRPPATRRGTQLHCLAELSRRHQAPKRIRPCRSRGERRRARFGIFTVGLPYNALAIVLSFVCPNVPSRRGERASNVPNAACTTITTPRSAKNRRDPLTLPSSEPQNIFSRAFTRSTAVRPLYRRSNFFVARGNDGKRRRSISLGTRTVRNNDRFCPTERRRHGVAVQLPDRRTRDDEPTSGRSGLRQDHVQLVDELLTDVDPIRTRCRLHIDLSGKCHRDVWAAGSCLKLM